MKTQKDLVRLGKIPTSPCIPAFRKHLTPEPHELHYHFEEEQKRTPPKPLGEIYLFLSDQLHWCVDYGAAGEYGEFIHEIFGSYIVPTPWGSGIGGSAVKASIQSKTPKLKNYEIIISCVFARYDCLCKDCRESRTAR